MFRKSTAILLLLAIMSGPAMAQHDESAATPSATTAKAGNNKADDTFPGSLFPRTPVATWSVGLIGGVDNNHHVINVSYATDMKYTDRSGITAGVAVSYNPTGWFSLHSGIALVQKNYRMDRDNRYVSFIYTESTNNYFLMPLTAQISLGREFRVCGIFGGYVGYWYSGHREGMSLSVPSLVTNSTELNAFDNDYVFDSRRDNRFDAGWVFGVALRYALLHKVDLSAELRWYYGVTDMQKSYMSVMNPRYNTTRSLQFGVAYWL